MEKEIYLAGGCFWGTEHYFKQIAGVVETEVGFANGHTEHPTYKEVYTDTTGFAETVRIKFNPNVVSLEFLLRMFFKAIDPTSLNKQGHDEGTRYRTGIYYTDPTDLPIINKVYDDEQHNYDQPFAVERQPLQNFYPAEDYHQDYLDKNPDGYCHLPLSLFKFAREARDTMNKLVSLLAFLFVFSLSLQAKKIEPYGPLPSENQLRWQEMEMYAFIHYSMNTYTDQEWGFGNEDLQLFNPSNLDCRQWARVCKQSGMRGIIFTAKHHCGFCMWPSAYTEYSVKNTPWKNGQGDVVRELAEACRKEGLKFAVYLSPWDRNHPEYGRPAYVEYFRNQLRELLTNYGDIFEVWFDGANGGDGWYGGANERRQITKDYYGWSETFKMIRKLQPKCVIWSDAGGDRGDLRWVGTEAGFIGETNWSLVPREGRLSYQLLHYGTEDGELWVPGETNTSIRPGWFYHETENQHVKSLSKLMDTYYKSVGRNSCLLLNFPIAPNGRIHPIDSLRGLAFKRMIDEVFKKNVVKEVKRPKLKDNSFTIAFKRPARFNRFLAEEDIRLGQRVRKFAIEAFVDGQWQPLKDQLVDNGDGLTTIGHRRIICFPTVTASKLRFTIIDTKAEPVIKRLGLYLAPDITADTPDSGEKKSSALHIFFSSPTQMLIDWDAEQTFTTFRYLPPQDTKEGIITHYTLWCSSDWSHWTKLASGEFSNIVNNPIWQTITFPPTKARIFKFDADRLAAGTRMGYSDIEVISQ